MIVPSPPIFTPSNKAFQSEVKFDRRIEVGKLLINWLKNMELKKTEVSPLKLARANVSSASECEMFPMKIKKTDKGY